jgi:hypothetical protein
LFVSATLRREEKGSGKIGDWEDFSRPTFSASHQSLKYDMITALKNGARLFARRASGARRKGGAQRQ